MTDTTDVSTSTTAAAVNGPSPPDRPIRACFVIGVPPDEYSGATLHAQWLARRLTSMGVDIEFVSLTDDREQTMGEIDGVPFHYVWRNRGRMEEVGVWFRLLRFFLRHRRYDVIHVQSAGYPSSFTALVAKWLRIPSLATVMIQRPGFVTSGWVTRHIHRALVTRFRRIVPISNETYAEAVAAGVSEDQLTQIPISVDVDRFRPRDREERMAFRQRFRLPIDRPVVAFVGALCDRKNVRWLIDTWMTTDATADHPTLFLVGDAADAEGPAVRDYVRDAVARAPARLGWVPFVEDIETVYALSDVLVLPSRAEGMPTVVLQAMATGTPVLVTPVSGAPELVGFQGERGRLFGFDDAQQFWQHLRDLLEDGDLRASIGAAARAYMIDHYSLDAVARQYRNLYVELLTERS